MIKNSKKATINKFVPNAVLTINCLMNQLFNIAKSTEQTVKSKQVKKQTNFHSQMKINYKT